MMNIELIKGLYQAFSQGDMPAVLACLDPGVSWFEAEGNPIRPNGEPWIGREIVLTELFFKLGSEWDGFHVNAQKLWDAGRVIVAEGRYTGTFKATGHRTDQQFCHIWTIHELKVINFQQYTDTAQMQRVMNAR